MALFEYDGEYYVSIQIPKKSDAGEIVFCIDISGSMGGSPMESVNKVLEQIRVDYGRDDYKTLCYSTTVTEGTLKNLPFMAGGGTYFRAIFEAMRNFIAKTHSPISFIFMTDGEDTGGDPKNLELAISGLKMISSAAKYPVTVNVIGFGNGVNNEFLQQIRKYGNREGIFQYAAESKELVATFQTMFGFATLSQEVEVMYNDTKRIITTSGESIEFSDPTIKVGTKVTLVTKEQTIETVLEKREITSYDIVKLLARQEVKNEDDVRELIAKINGVSYPKNVSMIEKIDFESTRKEVVERMLKYLELFSSMKEGQINERDRLTLASLKSSGEVDPTLLRRKNKNTEYFVKTNIHQILTDYKQQIPDKRWEQMKEYEDDWICPISTQNWYQMMRSSVDNFMCMGIRVKRDGRAVTEPEKGFNLEYVSPFPIAFDQFRMMTERGDKVVDGMNKHINAVVPLYLSAEHMFRVRRLQGIWMGYLFTQDPYGYDKRQELGFMKLFKSVIDLLSGTSKDMQIIEQLRQVCEFLVTESEGFRTVFGDTYEQFKKNILGRNNRFVQDLDIPLVVGHIVDGAEASLQLIYQEYVRREINKTVAMSGRVIRDVVKQLLYGDGKTTVAVRNQKTDESTDRDPDYIEKSFIDFFHDIIEAPISIIGEKTSGSLRREIVHADPQLIESLLPPLPKNLEQYQKLFKIDLKINYEQMRKEMIFGLTSCVRGEIGYDGIITYTDQNLQGEVISSARYTESDENLEIIVHVALNAKSLEGFAGVVRRFCSHLFSKGFFRIVDALLERDCPLRQEKLVALLNNRIGTDMSGGVTQKIIMRNLVDYAWLPLNMKRLRTIVTDDQLKDASASNYGKRVLHRYRLSNKPNRLGHSNLDPYRYHNLVFKGYDYYSFRETSLT